MNPDDPSVQPAVPQHQMPEWQRQAIAAAQAAKPQAASADQPDMFDQAPVYPQPGTPAPVSSAAPQPMTPLPPTPLPEAAVPPGQVVGQPVMGVPVEVPADPNGAPAAIM